MSRSITWIAPPDGWFPLRWPLMKTIQHAAEHTPSVLSIALFWDHYARKERLATVHVERQDQ